MLEMEGGAWNIGLRRLAKVTFLGQEINSKKISCSFLEYLKYYNNISLDNIVKRLLMDSMPLLICLAPLKKEAQ